jgi:16S rRNA processing protein RimM
MANDPAHLVVGHLSKPHGTRGELVVWPLTDRPDEVFAPGRRLVLGTDKGEAGQPPREVVVAASRPHKRGVLVRLEGVMDRNAAEALVTRYLLIPAYESEELEEGEFYYHQLLGLTVETADGVELGRVREVYETEPTHLLEVKGEGVLHLIPLSRRIVTLVDVQARRLVIDPPEGLLDL